MVVFCILSALMFQALAFANLRRGYYIYLASLPLLPAYIAIPLVKGGAGISLVRMLTYALALATVVAVWRNRNGWLTVFQKLGKWPVFLFVFLVLYLAKLISTAANQNPIALLYWLDEFIGVALVFILAARYVTSTEELRRLFTFLLPVLFLQAGIVFVEVMMNNPILKGVVEIEVSTVGEKLSGGFERAGEYRAVGMFENPLSLAEYLLVGGVMLMGAYGLQDRKKPLLMLLGLLVVFSALSFTAARFSLLALALAGLIATVFYYGYRLSASSRPLLWAVAGSLLSFLGYIAYLAVTDVNWILGILNAYFGEDASGTASVLSRASQYVIIPAEILGTSSFGLLGEGLRSDLIERLDVRLDNHYLRVLIEGGMTGLAAFVTLIVLAFLRAVSPVGYRNLQRGTGRRLRFFFIFFFVLFAVDKFFLSMSYNNQYFFLFAGIALSLLAGAGRNGNMGGRIAYPARA